MPKIVDEDESGRTALTIKNNENKDSLQSVFFRLQHNIHYVVTINKAYNYTYMETFEMIFKTSNHAMNKAFLRLSPKTLKAIWDFCFFHNHISITF